MPTVETPPEAYQDLPRIRDRVDYQPDDFYTDPNAAIQFDELLVKFEKESRGIFKTLWGDQTPLTEEGRVDTFRAPDVAAHQLVYPITDVQTVEIKRTLSSDWETLDSEWWDFDDHHIVLARRPTLNGVRYHTDGNPADDNAQRAEWADLAAKVRVTYDRGFGEAPPADVLSIQVDLINNLLRQRKREQTVAAASPEEFAGQTETAEVVTQAIRDRISDVTKPGLATTVV